MADEVDAARAAEILEGDDPQVGSCQLRGHLMLHVVGDTTLGEYDLRGAAVEHRVKRDLPEMAFALVVTAVATPTLFFMLGEGCSIASLLLGLFFAWVMWIKGNYLHITTAKGEEHEIHVPEELAGELDLLILRIMMLNL